MSPPTDRRYTAEQVWARPEGDYLIRGITEHAQDALGTIEILNLPAVGERLSTGAGCRSLESLETVSDLISPLAAEVVEHKSAIELDPALIYQRPYNDGWLLRLKGRRENSRRILLRGCR